MSKRKQKMVHFRWNFEIFAKKIPQGWLNTLEVFLERLIYYVKKFSKSGRISIQICTPGCSPWQARNIDRLVVISFLRLMRPKGRLCSAVEGTPKGVQKRYARLSNLLYGFHVTNYVLGSHPQKTYFSHSCQTLTGK